MNRPIGYTILAVLLALMSLGGLAAVVWWPDSLPFAIELPITVRALSALQGIAGIAAAWAIWSYHRSAPEVYIVWAVIALANMIYDIIAIMPRIMRVLAQMAGAPAAFPTPPIGMFFVQLLIYGGILGLGYWYLTARRRPAEV
jgi:hypothetical protein